MLTFNPIMKNSGYFREKGWEGWEGSTRAEARSGVNERHPLFKKRDWLRGRPQRSHTRERGRDKAGQDVSSPPDVVSLAVCFLIFRISIDMAHKIAVAKKVLSKHWLISVKEYAAIFNPVKVNLIPSLFIHIFWTLLSGWSLILPQLPNDHSAMSITDKRQVRHSSRLKRWQQLPSSEEGPCRFQDVGLIFDGNRLSNNSWYPPWPRRSSMVRFLRTVPFS